jgi:hypothetical protein
MICSQSGRALFMRVSLLFTIIYIGKRKVYQRIFAPCLEVGTIIFRSRPTPKTLLKAYRCYKSLGSMETLTAGGMADPVAFFQAEVDSLNQAKKAGGTPKISAVSPLIYMGYFPLKSIMEKLKVKRYIDLFKLTSDFQFDIYELLSSLAYARSVNPCSKLRTFHEVLPSLFHPCNYSYDQLLDGLSFLGANYEKIAELFSAQTSAVYGISTDKTYFDCTNFFFEIDREDEKIRSRVISWSATSLSS